jgi:hypothetical protein
MKTPTITSLIPLSVTPLVFWPKLESPFFFFPSCLRLLAKQSRCPQTQETSPTILSFDQPPTAASLTLLSSLLLLTSHCREDDEIRREAEGQKPHLKRKKNRVSLGSWVDPPGQPGCCTSRSFNKPEPVQVPGLPGPESTHQAGPSLITMPKTTRLGWPMLEKLFKTKINKN